MRPPDLPMLAPDDNFERTESGLSQLLRSCGFTAVNVGPPTARRAPSPRKACGSCQDALGSLANRCLNMHGAS
jgi:hypothetical protein